jgi:hypothetical protein
LRAFSKLVLLNHSHEGSCSIPNTRNIECLVLRTICLDCRLIFVPLKFTPWMLGGFGAGSYLTL